MSKEPVKKQQADIDIDGAVKYKKEYDKLQSLIGDINKTILDAGKIVCFLMDNDKGARIEFRNRGIPPMVYNRLERVGRGLLLPELSSSLTFARLPIDQQRRVVSEKVEFLVSVNNGKPSVLMVDLLTSDPLVVDQVVGKDKIRDLGEQRQYMELKSRQDEVVAERADMPWVVVGRKVEIRDGVYTLAELMTIVKALKAKNR